MEKQDADLRELFLPKAEQQSLSRRVLLALPKYSLRNGQAAWRNEVHALLHAAEFGHDLSGYERALLLVWTDGVARMNGYVCEIQDYEAPASSKPLLRPLTPADEAPAERELWCRSGD